MFHPSSFLVIVGLFAFIGAIGLSFFLACRSAAVSECVSCAVLGAVATLALLSALPDSIVAVHDPDTNGELIVYGPPLTRWVTAEAALGDSKELFFERVAVVPNQPTAGPKRQNEAAESGERAAPLSGKPFACVLLGLAASTVGLGSLGRRLWPEERRVEIWLWLTVAAAGIASISYGFFTS